MGQPVTDVLTLAQFLRLPEIKPALEFIGGRIIQKMSPRYIHSKLGQTLWLWVYQFTAVHGLGETFQELRCTFGGESLVPDLAYFAPGRTPADAEGKYLDRGSDHAPDLLIEILSPGQTVKALSRRLTRCVSKEVRLAWLVRPKVQSVLVFRPGRPPVELGSGDELDGEDVLPGFRLALDEMFAWLAVGTKPFPPRP